MGPRSNAVAFTDLLTWTWHPARRESSGASRTAFAVPVGGRLAFVFLPLRSTSLKAAGHFAHIVKSARILRPVSCVCAPTAFHPPPRWAAALGFRVLLDGPGAWRLPPLRAYSEVRASCRRESGSAAPAGSIRGLGGRPRLTFEFLLRWSVWSEAAGRFGPAGSGLL
jgi:hypothetical protein